MSNLTAYRKTAKAITVTLPASISGATDVKFYVNTKESASFSGATLINGATGTTSNGITTFNITAAQNNITEKVYFYNIIATYLTKTYVIAEGSYSVLPSLIS